MSCTMELLFIDPSICDIETVIGGLRSEVEAIVLAPDCRPAQQMVAALKGRDGIGAIHIMAHGTPGKVAFAAGEWSAETLADEADELRAIGDALLPGGTVRLWSCRAGAGREGANLVARLAQATGAEIAAASDLIGAAALGGVWTLAPDTRPPLTEAGIAEYRAVLALQTWKGPGGSDAAPTSGIWDTAGNWDGAVPGPGDVAYLGGTGAYTVTVDASGIGAVMGALFVGDTNATLAFGANTLSNLGQGPIDSVFTSYNYGTITVAANATVFDIGIDTFNNNGLLSVASGGQFQEGAGNLNNSGTITDVGQVQAGVTFTNTGTVTLSGGSLQVGYIGFFSTPATLNNTGAISGTGTITPEAKVLTLAGGGTYEASGGALEIGAPGSSVAIGADVTGLAIDNSAGSVLQIDQSVTVAAGAVVTFLGGTGTLRLLDIADFHGTVAGMTVGPASINPFPTNQIDITTIGLGSIASANLNTSTDVLSIHTTDGAADTIQLSGSYAPGTFVRWSSDGSTGTDLYLNAASPQPQFSFIGTKPVDSWLDPAAWGNTVPPTSPAPGTDIAFDNMDQGADYAYMPARLSQATGTGSSTWSISDSIALNGNPYTSSMTLVNQGQLFVNGTNNFTPGSATTYWTLSSAASGLGQAVFENDGAVNVIGTSGGGSTSAIFAEASNMSPLDVTGNGSMNLYGNAELGFGQGVGVGSGQTIDFIHQRGNTNGQVFEQDALIQHATFAGFLPGDSVTLQNLGGLPTETVTLGNGEATVNVMVGGALVDEVRFLGNFASAGAFNFSNDIFNNGEVTIEGAPTLSVQVSGTARVGSSLVATSVTNDADATVGYQWQELIGKTWTNIGATGSTYLLAETDEGQRLRVVATLTDSDGSGATATSNATAAVTEAPPVLTLAKPALTVTGGGSVGLGVTVASSDADDTVSVKIAGLTSYEFITDNADATIFSGASVTLTAAEVNSGLTLHSTYAGAGHPKNVLLLTATNSTPGEQATSKTQKITVTDPPAGSIGLLTQFMAAAFGPAAGSSESLAPQHVHPLPSLSLATPSH